MSMYNDIICYIDSKHNVLKNEIEYFHQCNKILNNHISDMKREYDELFSNYKLVLENQTNEIIQLKEKINRLEIRKK